MNWTLENIATVGLIMIFVSVWAIAKALDETNKKIERVCNLLVALENRQQTMNERLHEIAAHTERAVEDLYKKDDWERQAPPM